MYLQLILYQQYLNRIFDFSIEEEKENVEES